MPTSLGPTKDQINVAILVDYFMPGYAAGGPIRSIAGVARLIGRCATVEVFTRDRDFGSRQPYSNSIRVRVEGVKKVHYLSPFRIASFGLVRDLNAGNFHTVYINSFFSRKFAMIPLVALSMGLLKCNKVVVAPRGEFHPGALDLHRVRKEFYLWLVRATRLTRGVTWHATDDAETKDIRVFFGDEVNVVAERPAPPTLRVPSQRGKRSGEIEIAFISRISRNKNLVGAIEALALLDRPPVLKVAGAVDDKRYWIHCLKMAQDEGVPIDYLGTLTPAEVESLLNKSHLLLLPTFGENYGHIVIESLAAGCPVLTSDRVMWTDLSEWGAGWNVPPEDGPLCASRVQAVREMGQDDFDALSLRAYEYIKKRVAESAGTAEQQASRYLDLLT